LALSPFSARAKHQKFRSLLPNPTETLATQAIRGVEIQNMPKAYYGNYAAICLYVEHCPENDNDRDFKLSTPDCIYNQYFAIY